MKKIQKICLVCLLTACSAGGKKCGSDNVDFNDLFNQINDNINSGEFNAALLQDQSIDASQLKALYGIDALEDLEEFSVHQSMVNISATEVAMLKVKGDKMDHVVQGVEKRIEDLKVEWKDNTANQLECIKNYKVLECGNYYYMIIAEDASKIKDFIEGK